MLKKCLKNESNDFVLFTGKRGTGKKTRKKPVPFSLPPILITV